MASHKHNEATRSQSRKLRGYWPRLILDRAHESGVTPRVSDADYIARIKAKITITEAGCWECAGFQRPLRNVKTHDKGYVAVGYRGTVQSAHRLMYRLLVGRIPNDMQVCHKCDNPPCCNPDHLFLGDQIANMRDMADKKRNKAAKTHCIRGHELSGDNVYWSNNGRRRSCKACDRLHQKRYWADGRAKERQKRLRARKRALREQGQSHV